MFDEANIISSTVRGSEEVFKESAEEMIGSLYHKIADLINENNILKVAKHQLEKEKRDLQCQLKTSSCEINSLVLVNNGLDKKINIIEQHLMLSNCRKYIANGINEDLKLKNDDLLKTNARLITENKICLLYTSPSPRDA